MRSSLFVAVLSAAVFLQSSACSTSVGGPQVQDLDAATAPKEIQYAATKFGANRFLPSGTIILSQRTPKREDVAPLPLAVDSAEEQLMAPLLGFFPVAAPFSAHPVEASAEFSAVGKFSPADNETWLEIDSATLLVTVLQGSAKIKELSAQGVVSLNPGQYLLVNKRKDPSWYAPDSYFSKRQLAVPGQDDPLRLRRGALGSHALYPAPDFPIHSAAVWTEEVGGLQVGAEELASLFEALPLGAMVVIK